MSPNNEEVTSQDYSQSGGEASNGGVSDYNNGAPPVFNMVYTGYYVNDVCPPTGEYKNFSSISYTSSISD